MSKEVSAALEPGLLSSGQTIGATACSPRQTVGPDQEVWLKQRILTAIRMALALVKESQVGADGPLLRAAIHGIAEGAAVEIIHTVNMEPGYVNLPRVPVTLG